MKERVKEMRVFGCRLNFWNNVTNHISHKGTLNDVMSSIKFPHRKLTCFN